MLFNRRGRFRLPQLAAAPDRSDHEHEGRAKRGEHEFVDLAVERRCFTKPNTDEVVSILKLMSPPSNLCSRGAIAGSVAITSPPIQPSNAAPSHTRIGIRSRIIMISAAPAIIIGMLTALERINSESWPFAAAATAMTLWRKS